MEGYLTQILGDNVEELYWSYEPIREEVFKKAYLAYLNDSVIEEETFEDWWNDRNYDFPIERVFVDEQIYV